MANGDITELGPRFRAVLLDAQSASASSPWIEVPGGHAYRAVSTTSLEEGAADATVDLHGSNGGAMGTPGTPTVTATGTTGATTYGYKIVSIDTRSGLQTTPAGTEGTASDGNAALSATNYNAISWTAVANAVGYRVYRTTGGATQGLIATLMGSGSTSLNDTGLVADGTTAPTVNTTRGVIPLTATDGLVIQALTTATMAASITNAFRYVKAKKTGGTTPIGTTVIFVAEQSGA